MPTQAPRIRVVLNPKATWFQDVLFLSRVRTVSISQRGIEDDTFSWKNDIEVQFVKSADLIDGGYLF